MSICALQTPADQLPADAAALMGWVDTYEIQMYCVNERGQARSAALRLPVRLVVGKNASLECLSLD